MQEGGRLSFSKTKHVKPPPRSGVPPSMAFFRSFFSAGYHSSSPSEQVVLGFELL